MIGDCYYAREWGFLIVCEVMRFFLLFGKQQRFFIRKKIYEQTLKKEGIQWIGGDKGRGHCYADADGIRLNSVLYL